MHLRLDVVRDDPEPAPEQSLRFLCVMLGTFTCAGLCAGMAAIPVTPFP
jgi:hypothetical protein